MYHKSNPCLLTSGRKFGLKILAHLYLWNEKTDDIQNCLNEIVTFQNEDVAYIRTSVRYTVRLVLGVWWASVRCTVRLVLDVR